MNEEELPLILHEDAFDAFFVPYRHPKTRHGVWGGMGLETFGEDFLLARSIDDNYIWTVVESGCDSDQWISPGIHYVNRICYFVTENPHNWLPVEFRAPRNMRSLTPLGLKRQIRKLERAMAQLSTPLTMQK